MTASCFEEHDETGRSKSSLALNLEEPAGTSERKCISLKCFTETKGHISYNIISVLLILYYVLGARLDTLTRHCSHVSDLKTL